MILQELFQSQQIVTTMNLQSTLSKSAMSALADSKLDLASKYPLKSSAPPTFDSWKKIASKSKLC